MVVVVVVTVFSDLLTFSFAFGLIQGVTAQTRADRQSLADPNGVHNTLESMSKWVLHADRLWLVLFPLKPIPYTDFPINFPHQRPLESYPLYPLHGSARLGESC